MEETRAGRGRRHGGTARRFRGADTTTSKDVVEARWGGGLPTGVSATRVPTEKLVGGGAAPISMWMSHARGKEELGVATVARGDSEQQRHPAAVEEP